MSGVTRPYAMQYKQVAASQTGTPLAATTGAKGDYLDHIICVVSTAATSAVTILDGATSIPILPNAVTPGIGTYVITLEMPSVSGAWSVTTGAGVAIIAVGIFSA